MRIDVNPGERCGIIHATEVGVAHVQRERQSKRRFQSREIAGNVGEQQRTRIHQNCLGFRMWRRRGYRAGEQTIRERLRHRVRLRCAGLRKIFGVLRDQVRGHPHLFYPVLGVRDQSAFGSRGPGVEAKRFAGPASGNISKNLPTGPFAPQRRRSMFWWQCRRR